jgi:hypothetical protein
MVKESSLLLRRYFPGWGLFPRRLSQLNFNPVFLRLGEMDYGKRFFKEEISSI